MNVNFDRILSQNEGKTLEFKENISFPENILKTAVAFANTAGGKIVIGVENHPKAIVGLENIQQEEERLANIISDSIAPQLIPDIQIIPWRNTHLIIAEIHFDPKPYYLKSQGPDNGVYIRHGSTNRKATPELIKEIQLLARNTSFDEQPCLAMNSATVDFRVVAELFEKKGKLFPDTKLRSLKLLLNYQGTEIPSNGFVLLFGKNRTEIFPDAIIRCARFKGITRTSIIDQIEIDTNLPSAVDQIISFVERNIRTGIEIGRTSHKEIPEYPAEVIREAVINSVVHTDYSIQGATIQVAIFDNRIEVTNPGELPFGLTLEEAISGISRLRNLVIGRVFKELGLIEQWGSGLGRMIEVCEEAGLRPPEFMELTDSFRVTIFNEPIITLFPEEWESVIVKYLREHGKISTKEANVLWQVAYRTTRYRLASLVNRNVLAEIGKGLNDPKRYYVLK